MVMVGMMLWDSGHMVGMVKMMVVVMEMVLVMMVMETVMERLVPVGAGDN